MLGVRVVCRKGVYLAPFMPPPARAGALWVPGEGGLCVGAPGCTPHRATGELQGLQGLHTVWGSEAPGAPEILIFLQTKKNGCFN